MPESRRALEIWARLIEPGDEAAGYLAASLGSVLALELVRSREVIPLLSALDTAGSIAAGVARFNRLDSVLADSLLRWHPRLAAAEAMVGQLDSNGYRYRLITADDAEWPSGLADLGWGAPFALWVRGSQPVLETTENWVALVGARASSLYGAQVCSHLVSGLRESAVGVISGGAYGIDSLAHSEALSNGVPTIAVLAGGVDRPYPPGNRNLLDRIAVRGAVISEVQPGTAPTKWRFLQRNRLIAAIAGCTVVVEAGWRSGSINTANHAIQMHRPVGAVPGSVFDATSAGCHRLLANQQAQVIVDSSDILEMMGVGAATSPTLSRMEFRGPLETRALDALTAQGRGVTSLAADAGLSVGEATLALANLQLEGLATEVNGRWRRVESSL